MSNERFMRRAIELSREGVEGGYGLPFGSTVVKDGEIVGEATTWSPRPMTPTAHAEVLAIRDAAQRLQTYDLSGCDLYATGRLAACASARSCGREFHGCSMSCR